MVSVGPGTRLAGWVAVAIAVCVVDGGGGGGVPVHPQAAIRTRIRNTGGRIFRYIPEIGNPRYKRVVIGLVS